MTHIAPVIFDSIAKNQELKKLIPNDTNEQNIPIGKTEQSFNSNAIYEEKLLEELNNTNETNNEKISFKEGAKLFGEGITTKIKDMALGIIKHPVKTALAGAATAGVIAAAPLVGLTSATVASGIAVVFAGISLVKAGGNIIETTADLKEGRYDEAREDIKT